MSSIVNKIAKIAPQPAPKPAPKPPMEPVEIAKAKAQAQAQAQTKTQQDLDKANMQQAQDKAQAQAQTKTQQDLDKANMQRVQAQVKANRGMPKLNPNPTLPVGVVKPGNGPSPTSPRYVGGGSGVPETYEGGGTGNGPSPGMASPTPPGMKRGGAVRSKPQTKFASGGSVGSASRRGDGIAQRGKTKGRMC